MRLFARSAVALLALAATAGTAGAQIQLPQDNRNLGTAAAEFLLLGAGARGMALGGAYAALVRDVESTYYNPAGLPLMEGPQALLTSMPYFADTDYFFGAFAFPFGDGQWGLGLSMGHFGFSDEPLRTEADPDATSGQTFGVSENFFALSFAHAFIDRFTGGVTVKFISDQLAEVQGETFALDIGTNYHTEIGGRPIALSFVVSNLGPQIEHSGELLDVSAFPTSPDPSAPVSNLDPAPARFRTQDFELPTIFRVGAAYDAIFTPASRLTVLAEFNETNINDPSWGFGGEYQWQGENSPVSLAARVSYAFQPDNFLSSDEEEFGGLASVEEGDNRGLDGLSFGGGLKYRLERYQVGLDYAFRHFGALGTVDVYSITFSWR